MLPHVWNLRSGRSFRVLRRCFRAARAHLGARLCEFSIQGNHIHLLCEAAHERVLARALQGLGIRIARGLNRLMSRRGRVLADRYHARILRTPTEVARARRYILDNARQHARAWGKALPPTWIDPFSSAAPSQGCTAAPRTWLLSVGWLRAPPA
jgi:REP element-mobilizing transposase RayT